MAHLVLCLADADYQGLADLHCNSQTPKKKPKYHPLTEEQKAANRDLVCQRIIHEHAIGKGKIFRVLSEGYRNRYKSFGRRYNLIAVFNNRELQTR